MGVQCVRMFGGCNGHVFDSIECLDVVVWLRMWLKNTENALPPIKKCELYALFWFHVSWIIDRCMLDVHGENAMHA